MTSVDAWLVDPLPEAETVERPTPSSLEYADAVMQGIAAAQIMLTAYTTDDNLLAMWMVEPNVLYVATVIDGVESHRFVRVEEKQGDLVVLEETRHTPSGGTW